MNTPSGKILLNESESRPLTRQADGSLTGSFTIDKQGFYRIELEGPHGEHVTASPQYTIDVTADRAPTVSFLKPGRDTHGDARSKSCSSRRKAVGRLRREAARARLRGQRRQGKDGQAVRRRRSRSPRCRPDTRFISRSSASIPGDFGLLLRASHRHRFGPDRKDRVERHLLRADPAVQKDFKPAQSQAQGGGGGGGGGNDVGQLSQQQKEIVAATFNVIRDKAKLSAEKYRENVVFLTLSQGKLKTQVEELIEKMRSRQVDQDERFKKISDLLSKASPEMGTAEADTAQAGSEDGDDARAGGAEISAGGRAGIRDAARPAAGRRRGRRRRPAAGQRPRGSVRARARQARESVPDAEAGRRATGPAEDGRARRQAEGARAAPAAGGRAAAADGGRPARPRRAAAPASGSSRTKRKKRRGVSSSSRATCRARTCRIWRGSSSQPRTPMRRAAANGSRDGGAQAQQALDKLRQAADQLTKGQTNRTKENIQDAQRQAEALASRAEGHRDAGRAARSGGAGAARRARSSSTRRPRWAKSSPV